MAELRSSISNAGACGRSADDEQFLDLLRRWVFETQETILQSRALIRSTRDAIELLDRWQARQSST